MRKYIWIISLLFAMTGSGATVSDDFERADTAYSTDGSIIGSGWVNADVGVRWRIANSVLEGDNTTIDAGILYNTNTVLNEGYIYSVDLKFANDWQGIAFNYQDTGNYYFFRVKPTGYQVIRVQDGRYSETFLNQAISLSYNTYYTIIVKSDGAGNFDCIIANQGETTPLNAVTNISDGTFSGGYAGLYVGGSGGSPDVTYDNFSLQPPPPTTGFCMSVVGERKAVNFQVASDPLQNEIDWPAFLAQHDMIWEELPYQWNEGSFCGNGQIGMMIYATPDDNRIDFHLGRQDITDHRKAPDQKSSLGTPDANVMYDYCRLDVGRMALRPAGQILSGTLHQDLWNAEIRGEIVTDLGRLSFRAFTPRDRMLNVIEIQSTEKTNGTPVDYEWEFLPGNPASPRAQTRPDHPEYVTNPDPHMEYTNGVSICVQPLLAGGDYATAWKENSIRSVLYISTANDVPASGVSAVTAVHTVQDAESVGLTAVETEHRDWWHLFYRQSFLTIPDAAMESFYWIQLYKMGSTSRTDGPAVDLFGPFFRISQWPGLWWNLNVQLTYWPFYPANHLDLAANFNRLLAEQFNNLVATMGKDRLGDLAWVLHSDWLYYQYSGDWDGLQSEWTPKAEVLLDAYAAMQTTNSLGQIELLPMGSPEYDGFALFKNTSYNLALLKWLLGSLIESNERAGANLEKRVQWQQRLDTLIPYPTDKNGLMIGSDQSFDMPHRHFSHLIAIYPLSLITWGSSAENFALGKKSLDHWFSFKGNSQLTGFSYTGAASLYNMLGCSDDAYKALQWYFTKPLGYGQIYANTMYAEVNGRNPTLETPLSAANSIIEFLLQSWGGKIRIFPSVPDDWSDVTFHQMRAQGGFLVSASGNKGRTEWVAIESLAGEPCVITVPDWQDFIPTVAAGDVSVEKIGENEFRIGLAIGEQIILTAVDGDLAIRSVPHAAGEINSYGVKRGQRLPVDQSWQLPPYNPFGKR
ncbi:MAG: glycoside hydrolase family 95-like protein [Kiritimatiellales bacterium]